MRLETATNILLCLRYGIGDLVMELPVLMSLRAALPAARITGLGALPALELLEGEPWLDTRVPVQSFGYREWADGGDAWRNARFSEWFRAQGFDTVLDPSHAVFGVGATLWHEGAVQMFDVSRELLGHCLARGLDGYAAVRQSIREGWGLQFAEPAHPSLTLAPHERAAAMALLADAPPGDRPLAAVASAASSHLKRWPLERFAAVAEYLGNAGYSVIAIGAPEETDAERAVLASCATYVQPQHLRVTAALLEGCRLVVCNDTGLMHLAAAVGCAVVPVFGPTSPSIYAPPGAIAVGLAAPPPCRRETEFGPPECVVQGMCRQGEPPCIAQIGPEPVFAAIDRITRGERAWQPPTVS